MTNNHFTALMIRLSLGFIYLSAGWAKLASDYLGHIIGPPDLSSFTHSQILILSQDVVAIFQIIVGALILSQKHSLLGLILLIPLSIGILIFALVAGFGGTPVINLFLLILNLLALTVEKKPIQSIKKFDYSRIFKSEISKLYPQSGLNITSAVLIFIIICGTVYPGNWLNVIATIYILLTTLNLLQFQPVLFIDKIIFFLFFVICFIVINGQFLNSLVPGAYHSVFYLILFGFVLFFIRLGFFRFYLKRNT